MTAAKGNLILTRRNGQRIVIGEDIVVTVVNIRNDIVKLGIEAPRDVLVLRGELVKDGHGEDQRILPADEDK